MGIIIMKSKFSFNKIIMKKIMKFFLFVFLISSQKIMPQEQITIGHETANVIESPIKGQNIFSPPQTEVNEALHQYIVREAYKLLKDEVGPISYLENRLGSNETGSYPFSLQGGKIVTGAWREDSEDIVWWHEILGFGWYVTCTHFWEADAGDLSKFTSIPLHDVFENAYWKAQKYLYGNWDGSYWELQVLIQATGFIEVYRAPADLATYYQDRMLYYEGYYDTAGRWIERGYWWESQELLRDIIVSEILGRVCHLLADVSVPAHAHRDQHDGTFSGTDSYEDFISVGGNYINYDYQDAQVQAASWPYQGPGGVINVNNNPNPIKYLFYTSQQIADHFPSDDESGDNGYGVNEPFSDFPPLQDILNLLGSSPTVVDYSDIADASLVYSIRATAGLLYWFTASVGELPTPAPENVSATFEDNRINIQWDELSESDGYNIYRSIGSSATYTKLNTSILHSASYNDFNLRINIDHNYKVKAVFSHGESGYSDIASMYVPFYYDDCGKPGHQPRKIQGSDAYTTHPPDKSHNIYSPEVIYNYHLVNLRHYHVELTLYDPIDRGHRGTEGSKDPLRVIIYADNTEISSGAITITNNPSVYSFRIPAATYSDGQVQIKVRRLDGYTSVAKVSEIWIKEDSPFVASITGDEELEQGQSGTWDATYTGGSGTVSSYQWWKKIGSGSWISIGGNSASISTTMGIESFTLKVGVTKGGYYDEDTHNVAFVSPPAFDVWITGPEYIPPKYSGTWEANYDGGTGTVSYQWWKQYDGSNTWNSVGTASSYSSNMGSKCFTLKLRVTRGSDYEEVTKYVSNEDLKFNGKNFSALQAIPEKHFLYQNFPNPFNPETKISFDLPEDANVKINIYDTGGRLVSNLVSGFYSAGHHSASFNASSLSSGIYIYIIEAGSFKQIQKMTLIK